MRILADEGFNGNFVSRLRSAGFLVEWILEDSSGIPDEEVIQIAKANNQILLTEDKDFGEWVFAHKIRGLTIILVRYTKEEVEDIYENLKSLLEGLKRSTEAHQFITITKNKIRRRIM